MSQIFVFDGFTPLMAKICYVWKRVFCWCSISKSFSNCSVSYCSSILSASYLFFFSVNILISFGWDCQVERVLAHYYILKEFVLLLFSFTNDLSQKGENGIASHSHFFCIFGQSLLFLSHKEGEEVFRLRSNVSDPFVLQF